MTIYQRSSVVLISILSAVAGFCQTPPANDNFDSGTDLTSASVSFSGSLSNATIETGEVGAPSGGFSLGGKSIWWIWTAPTSTPVIITLSRDPAAGTGVDALFEVFTGAAVTNLQRQDFNLFDFPGPRYVIFNSVAGTPYHFRAAGSWTGTMNFQLTSSTVPQILVQPASTVVSLHGSVTFYVIAAGLPSPGFQWLSNGVPIPGQTAPVMLLDNVLSNATPRNYSVVITNSGGSVESAVAALTVREIDPVPVLGAMPPMATNVPFTLRGEPGRWYRFRVTSNFVNWTENAFGFVTNETMTFSVQRLPAPQQFIGAALNVETEMCMARLRAFAAARDLYGIEHKRKVTSNYVFTDLFPYLIGGPTMYCPQTGTYVSAPTLTNNIFCTFYKVCGHTIGNSDYFH